MAKNLEEQFKEPSVEELKRAVEALKKAAKEENSQKEIRDFKENPLAKEIANRPTIQKEEKIVPEVKFAEIKAELLDLTGEKIKLEKVLQEINTLKGKIIQRIELLKGLEKRKKEIDRQLEDFNRQLTSLKKENNDLLDEIKNKLSN